MEGDRGKLCLLACNTGRMMNVHIIAACHMSGASRGGRLLTKTGVGKQGGGGGGAGL